MPQSTDNLDALADVVREYALALLITERDSSVYHEKSERPTYDFGADVKEIAKAHKKREKQEKKAAEMSAMAAAMLEGKYVIKYTSEQLASTRKRAQLAWQKASALLGEPAVYCHGRLIPASVQASEPCSCASRKVNECIRSN